MQVGKTLLKILRGVFERDDAAILKNKKRRTNRFAFAGLSFLNPM
jgi:hypothetical protein